MDILIFIIIIVALVVVHEFGHFVVAKLAGMRVDEFGIGYPPRALVIAKVGETEYTLNWLPFGGFVKIYGEDGTQEQQAAPTSEVGAPTRSVGGAASSRAFSSRPRILQALVLIAGVAMNAIFAYVLLTGALVSGTPRALMVSEIDSATDVTLAVARVFPGTPAADAGLMPGDSIVRAVDEQGMWEANDPGSFASFIAASEGSETTLTVERGGVEQTIIARAEAGFVPSDPSRYALGVEVAPIGVVPLSFTEAVREGAVLTWGVFVLTAEGLWNFFSGVFTFSADLSQVAGPIGIAGIVGSASDQGFGSLLALMAIISINLALINLIPIPALDGGRLLFVIIESIIRRPIHPGFARAINALGFAFLILLMLVVTAHDIFRIVG